MRLSELKPSDCSRPAHGLDIEHLALPVARRRPAAAPRRGGSAPRGECRGRLRPATPSSPAARRRARAGPASAAPRPSGRRARHALEMPVERGALDAELRGQPACGAGPPSDLVQQVQRLCDDGPGSAPRADLLLARLSTSIARVRQPPSAGSRRLGRGRRSTGNIVGLGGPGRARRGRRGQRQGLPGRGLHHPAAGALLGRGLRAAARRSGQRRRSQDRPQVLARLPLRPEAGRQGRCSS